MYLLHTHGEWDTSFTLQLRNFCDRIHFPYHQFWNEWFLQAGNKHGGDREKLSAFSITFAEITFSVLSMVFTSMIFQKWNTHHTYTGSIAPKTLSQPYIGKFSAFPSIAGRSAQPPVARLERFRCLTSPSLKSSDDIPHTLWGFHEGCQ